MGIEFDEIEGKAEAKITAALSRYEVAALTIGAVFAALLVAYGVMLFAGGALLGSVFAVVTAFVMIWLVALLRRARAALPPLTP